MSTAKALSPATGKSAAKAAARQAEEPDRRRDRRLGGRHRHGGPCPGRLRTPSCSPAPRPRSAPSPTATSRWSTRPCPACCRSSTRSASRRPSAPASASRPQINLQQRLRPQELLLSRPAAGLSDQPVQAARSSARARSRSTSTARPMHVGIERLHLEQDAGKSIHDQHPDYDPTSISTARAWR